jgi:hypothetical protein
LSALATSTGAAPA